jgi:hypothetical protein
MVLRLNGETIDRNAKGRPAAMYSIVRWVVDLLSAAAAIRTATWD